MRDYPVKPLSMKPTTPAIVVEATQTKSEGARTVTRTQRIYGGVNLSPSDDVIETVANSPTADRLADEVVQKMADAPFFERVRVKQNNSEYEAVSLPGNDAKGLGANRLDEVDLIVPVQRGRTISLVRSAHSFFHPRDVLGSGWAFDLPRLETLRKPVARSEDAVKITVFFQLTSPFNSYQAMFAEQRHVSELNAKLLAPAKPGAYLGLAAGTDQRIGEKTRRVLLRDGRSWYFDQAGYFVAEADGPLTSIYRRDQTHRIRRIEGWYGDDLRADIQLEYNGSGQLVSAKSSDDQEVAYQYDEAGRLTAVKRADAEIGYEYQNGLVAKIMRDGKTMRQFVYNERGQVESEKGPDGNRVDYTVQRIAGGIQVSVTDTTLPEPDETVAYDSAFRPLNRVFADGSRVDWEYDAAGAVKKSVTQPDGLRYLYSLSADGKQQTLQLPEGGVVTDRYDDSGRLAARYWDKERVLAQDRSHGLLSSIETPTSGVYPRYRQDGVMTGIVVAKPESNEKFKYWQSVELDELGRTEEVTDYTGAKIQLGYDRHGDVAVLNSPRGRVEIQRDKEGRVEQVASSWGAKSRIRYDDKTGALTEIELYEGKNKANLEFKDERVDTVKQFDGGEILYRYYKNDHHAGQVKEIQLPNKLAMNYEYDKKGRIASVTMGDRSGYRYKYNEAGQLVSLELVPSER